MYLTERDIQILLLLRLFWYLRVSQIRDRLTPKNKDGSIIRGRLRKMEHERLIKRYEPKLIDSFSGTMAPVFVLTLKGASVLAAQTGDPSHVLITEVTFQSWMNISHYVRVGELHMKIVDAFGDDERVKLTAMAFEHEVIKPDAQDPSKKFRLYTKISDDPKIVCCPDAAIETEVAGVRRVWFEEFETGADGAPERVINRKHKGYFGMMANNLFKKLFPQAKEMRVIVYCPSTQWRTEILNELKGKPGWENWLAVATPDVNKATFLHEPIFYKLQRDPDDMTGKRMTIRGPFPLIPPPKAPTVALPVPETLAVGVNA